MKFTLMCLMFITSGIISVKAQDKFTVNGKVDFVSNYVWRGSDQNSGFSVQPAMSLSYKGFVLSANGSQSLTNTSDGAQEFDINLGYSAKGFSLTVSDYWWNGMAAPYGHYSDGHHFEATLGYNFSELCNLPLSLTWSTWFAGGDDYKINDDGTADRAYSTYIAASYDIAIPGGVTLTPAIGFTPWKSVYYKEATITDISLKASKSITITDKFSVPLFVQAIVAPHDTAKGVDKTYLVAGLSLGF